MYNFHLLIWRLSKRRGFSSNCCCMKKHFSMCALAERFQIIISAIKPTNTSCMTKRGMSPHGDSSTSFLEGCSGAILSVVTGKVYTCAPWCMVNRFSLTVWITHVQFFGISKAVTRTFTNVLVTLQKQCYETGTSKTNVMNLLMSVSIYKQQKESDISRKI